MKKHEKNLSFVFSMLLMFTALASWAQPKETTPGRAFKEQIQSYVQENVLPVLQVKRTELDAKLSSEDQEALDALRTQAKQQGENAKSFHQEIRKIREEGGTLTDAQKIQWADFHLSKEELHKSVREIAARNQAALQEVFASFELEREQWKEDLNALKEEFKDDKRSDGQNKQFRTQGKDGKNGQRGHRGRKHGFGKLEKLMRPEGFLLWDGTMPTARSWEADEEISEVMAYPNPAGSTPSNISFSTASAGKVQVYVLNSQGETVKTLLNQKVDAGEHTIVLNTDNLENGTYFYKIVTQKGTTTKRFVVRK